MSEQVQSKITTTAIGTVTTPVDYRVRWDRDNEGFTGRFCAIKQVIKKERPLDGSEDHQAVAYTGAPSCM